MKNSKLRGFGIWLMVLAVIFSSISFDINTYAEGGGGGSGGTGRDVTDRITLGRMSLAKEIGGVLRYFVENDEVKTNADGKLQIGTGFHEINPGNTLRLTYEWELPQDKMGEGEEHVRAGDYFHIPLPDAKFLKGVTGKIYDFKDAKGTRYGTYTVTGDDTAGYRIEATFSEAVNDKDALEKGWFTVECRAALSGEVTLKTDPEIKIHIYIPTYDPWGPGPLSKNGSSGTIVDSEGSPTSGRIIWTLVSGFDSLKILMENKSGHNTPEITLPLRNDFYVYDELPPGINIMKPSGDEYEIWLKVPLYAPTTDGKQLTYQANSGSIMYRLNLTLEVKQNHNETFDSFKTRVNQEAMSSSNTDHSPRFGVYQYTDAAGNQRESVVVALGSTPSEWKTYDDLYTMWNPGKPEQNTLRERLKHVYENEGKINREQYETMLKTYSPDGGQGIVAWAVEIRTTVDHEINKKYANNGNIYIENYDKPSDLNKSVTVEYAKIAGGVQGIKRISFTVKKVWAAGSTDTPSSVKVILTENSNLIESQTITLTAPTWQDSFANLPLMDADGNIYSYSVEEEAVPGFASTVSGNMKDGFVITNAPVPGDKMKITVTKKWNDPPSPQSNGATVILYLYPDSYLGNPEEIHKLTDDQIVTAGITKVATVTLNALNGWTHTFTNLPKVSEYKYIVNEVEIPGYTPTPEHDLSDENHPIYTFTNSASAGDKINIHVEKKWEGERLESVTVFLVATVNGVRKEIGSVVLNKNNNWQHVFENLAKPSDTLSYEIVEKPLKGYKNPQISEPETTSDGLKFVVTNTFIEPDPVSLTITKTWIGEPAEKAVFEIYKRKTKDGATTDESTGKRVELKPDTTPAWSATVFKLPKLDDDGLIDYVIKEIPILGYEAEIMEESPNVFKVVNTQTVTYSVKKVWKDGDTELTGDDIKDLKATVVLKKTGADGAIETIELNKNNSWQYTFTKVQKADASGPIAYEIQEVQVEGFEKGVVTFDETTSTFTITNKKKATTTTTTTTTTTATDSSSEVVTTTEEDKAESTTEKTTAKTTEGTTDAAATTGAETTAPVTTTEADSTTAETTTEGTTTSEAALVTTVTTTTAAVTAPPVVTTAPPTPAPTTRTFEFIEIDEDVPLAVKTTAPLDLELILIEESIPLGFNSLPYTGFMPNELFIGFGMLIVAIGAVCFKRMM